MNLLKSKSSLVNFYIAKSSPLTNLKTFLVSILFSSIIYGFCVSYGNPLLDNIAALLFVVSLLIHCLWAFRLPQNLWMFCFIPVLLHLGILLGGMHAIDPTKIFWGFDSISYHIPHSINAFSDIKNLINLKAKSYSESLLVTHLVTGLVFKILGVSVLTTTLSMLIVKIPTAFVVYLLGERLFSSKVGYLSAITFLLYPSVIVFDAIFFKEITIQFLLISFFVLLYDFSLLKKGYLIIPIFIMLLLTVNERSYLIPSMFGALVLASYFYVRDFSIQRKFLAWGVIGLIFAFFVYYFSTNYPPSKIIARALEVRGAYKGISSVDTKWNYDIPYALAIVKIIFTPFFTFGKFSTYFGLTSLIVWSALLNQFIILISLFGIFHSLKTNKYHYPVILSFIIYILLLAFFRPYDGRVRDSYLPILIIFSMSAFCSFSEKLMMKK